MVDVRDEALRSGLFAHLAQLVSRSADGTVRSADVNGLQFEGRPFQVIGQQGIRKVAGLEAALSFTTVYRPPGADRPYDDQIGDDGLVRYKYRGNDPEHPDNRALRVAMLDRRPMAYFVGVAPGVYVPQFPVYLVAEDRSSLEFSVALDEAQSMIDVRDLSELEKRTMMRLTLQRLDQTTFRSQLLIAYQRECALCRLRYVDLLDAAHILPYSDPRSRAVVPNGLLLCKIHHAAFDKHIVGIRPDLGVEVRADVLAAEDGPMLRHGLQELDGARVIPPRSRHDRPDEGWLHERYQTFRQAG